MTPTQPQLPFATERDSRAMTRHYDHPTSVEAAEVIEPALSELQRKVLAFIIARGSRGATDSEIRFSHEFAGMAHTTATKRRTDLYRKGLVTFTGGTRLNPNGRKERVWVAV